MKLAVNIWKFFFYVKDVETLNDQPFRSIKIKGIACLGKTLPPNLDTGKPYKVYFYCRKTSK